MKVFKFGGASVKSANAVRNLLNIIHKQDLPLFIVISAMDKTTNELEKLLDLIIAKKDFSEQLHKIYDFHKNIVNDLDNRILTKFDYYFDKFKTVIPNCNTESYHENYDKIVSFGEIFSTVIISEFLNLNGIENTWLDARKILITDANFRQANIDFETTKKRLQEVINDDKKIYISQGFIGGTKDGKTTTLGREGSDYSAAVFANLLNAESITLWKDVDGIYNADPKNFENAEKIEAISYSEATELAFFGMKIIHPRTAKPLIDKNIRLFVKSFNFPLKEGTVIANFDYKLKPQMPVFIFNRNQALLTLRSKEFEFISEKFFERIFRIFYKHKIKINLIQNSALTVSLCFDYSEITFDKLLNDLKIYFETRHNKNLTLLIIRHYNEKILKKYLKGKIIYLEQKNRVNAFYVYENTV